jgi:hypothetical protein
LTVLAGLVSRNSATANVGEMLDMDRDALVPFVGPIHPWGKYTADEHVTTASQRQAQIAKLDEPHERS